MDQFLIMEAFFLFFFFNNLESEIIKNHTIKPRAQVYPNIMGALRHHLLHIRHWSSRRSCTFVRTPVHQIHVYTCSLPRWYRKLKDWPMIARRSVAFLPLLAASNFNRGESDSREQEKKRKSDRCLMKIANSIANWSPSSCQMWLVNYLHPISYCTQFVRKNQSISIK